MTDPGPVLQAGAIAAVVALIAYLLVKLVGGRS